MKFAKNGSDGVRVEVGPVSRQAWVAENDGALGFVLVVLLRVFLATPVVHSAKPF